MSLSSSSIGEAFRGKTLLVTGATGYIGRRLVGGLQKSGARVVAVQRGGRQLPATVASITVPVWETGAIRQALRGFRIDGLFNLAAYGVRPGDRDPDLMARVNTEAALTLFDCAEAAGARFFIQAGTQSEYAAVENHELIAETAPVETEKLYGASKAKATLDLLKRSAAGGPALAVARIFGVYGPDEAPHRLMPSLLSRLRGGERVALSEGRQIRDFLHVDDVVDALCSLADRACGQGAMGVVNVCSGAAVSVRQFAIAVADEMNSPRSLLGFGDIPARPDDLAYVVGSTAKLQALANWRPRYGLQDGIRATINASSKNCTG